MDKSSKGSKTLTANSRAWVPASKAETRRIIKARRAEALDGTLSVESAVELTRAYQGFKRGCAS